MNYSTAQASLEKAGGGMLLESTVRGFGGIQSFGGYTVWAAMTSIFEGQPPKTRPKLQSKQG